MINEFTVEAVDLGDLEKLRIGHNNSGQNKLKKKHDNQCIVSVLYIPGIYIYCCNQEVHLAGFWTGSRLTPPLRDKNYVSHVAAGWIKERMMVRS